MAKNIELLLLKSIEHLGIVGDIVKVKPGYARNYLLPLGLAETPTPSKIEALKEERAKAELELAELHKARTALLERMQDVSITLVRSCNDKGHLYGSVTQRDISDQLIADGYGVDVRSVRLNQPIRNIGPYDVPIQFDKDLRTTINVVVEPDQPLEEREEMEFDDEGNLIEKEPPKASRKKKEDEERTPEAAETAESAS